ncbi:50S ribosomal protein L7/L12 [Ligilactobacillus pobuzihii]|uniref:50S ribosomal protein L7/L12 n=1 Tax=Ligilactobacillus pobuzihii TaxID=449659 RepID=UPI0019D1F886|nr:50S ribosomal protein L7/L12 [Ligilactobacillus pobuzihii]MBN7273852.1 50S ribosomal protein L7/L12 [Ligilactobacillus pobuzihii]
MALDTEKIIADLKDASILELNDLVSAIEDEFGVSAAAPVAAAGADGGDQGGEQTEFDVELATEGDAKVKTIKLVKDITGKGLKDAKAAVDGLPTVIKEQTTKEDAEDIQAQFKELGAVVNLK